MVVAGELIASWDGVTELSTGVEGGAVTLRTAAGEVPPPGVGLTTVTLRFAVVASSAIVSWNVSCVPLR
jgi:hypothetical protein